MLLIMVYEPFTVVQWNRSFSTNAVIYNHKTENLEWK